MSRRYPSTPVKLASACLNRALGGTWPETLSYRSAKARRAGRRWGCVLCRILDRLDPEHCMKSIRFWES